MNQTFRAPYLFIVFGLWLIAVDAMPAAGASQTRAASSASTWLAGAAQVMGGESLLRSLATVETSGVLVWYHREQSERPEGPWLTSFTDFTDVRRFDADVVRRTSRTRGFAANDWIDSVDWTPPSTILSTSGVAFSRANGALVPVAAPADLDILQAGLAPEHVILAARAAADLEVDADERFDGYVHHVVRFTYAGARVRLILNVPSLLPKAVEITRAHPHDMFLAPWGDVTQRVTFGLWTLEPNGLRYPRLWAFSTNGQPDGSLSITRVRINPPVEAADFEIPQNVRERFIEGRRRIADLPFGSVDRPAQELAPGIVKVPGSWDIVEVKQDDGVVIVEGPLTSEYSAKAIADARQRFGGAAIKAVITTSDAWPHIGGMREYVARGIPVYALDLNVPILTRLFAAKYESSPDALAKSPRPPRLKVVSGHTTIGSGSNRLEIYPFRTATGERQMMVYWPTHQLLYTSDLFTIRNEFIFLPQQVNEGVEAVAREHLAVKTAFGMHYGPLPWPTVLKSAAPPQPASH